MVKARQWTEKQLETMGIPDESVQEAAVDQARSADPFLAELLTSETMKDRIDERIESNSSSIEKSVAKDK